MTKKIAIIGYGASSIGFLYQWLKQDYDRIKNYQIDVFDQNKQQNAGGLGGLAYDGKLIVGQFSGSDQYIDISLQKELLNFFIENSKSENIQGDNSQDKISCQFSQNLQKHNLWLVPQSTTHLGTDQLRQVNNSILIKFIKKSEVDAIKLKFHFGQKIDSNEFKNNIDRNYDIVIFAVGRYGTTLMSRFRDDIHYKIQNNKVDLGIRFEIPSHYPNIKQLDSRFYEWKIKYKTKNNLFVRTFCHNPKGFVVTQSVDVLNEKTAIANGHSRRDEKSNNTNFAILVTQKFTQPFDNSVLYGKIIAQQANLLAGSKDKVILQTLGDFKNKKRTKSLFRVNPTLSKDKYLLGDLTYVLPARTYEAIVEFIDQLSIVIPEISYYDNLLYGVQVKFYNMKLQNDLRYKFIGDCSGKSRSIISAACTGALLANEILNQKS